MFENLNPTQTVKLAILAARETTKGRAFLKWSDSWLRGDNRTWETAEPLARGRNPTGWAAKAAMFLGQIENCPENGRTFEKAIKRAMNEVHSRIEEDGFDFPWTSLFTSAIEPENTALIRAKNEIKQSLARIEAVPLSVACSSEFTLAVEEFISIERGFTLDRFHQP